MADEQNTASNSGAAQNQGGQQPVPPTTPPVAPQREITADDLISLWGMQKPGSEAKTPPVSATPLPTPLPPKPASLPMPPPVPAAMPAPKPTPPPAVAPVAAPLPPAPKPAPVPPPPPPPVPQKAPAPSVPSSPMPPVPPRTPAPTPAAAPRPTPPPPRPVPVPPAPSAPLSPAPKPIPQPPPVPPRPAPIPAPITKSAPPQSPPPPPVKKAPPVLEGELVAPPRAPEPKEQKKEEKQKSASPATEKPSTPTTPSASKGAEEEVPFARADEGFMEKLDDFLHELNLSREGVMRACGCLVLLVILGFGIWFGWGYYKENYGASEVPPTSPTTAITPEQTGLPSTNTLGSPQQSIAQHVGETGVQVVTAIGTTEKNATSFAQYLMTFKRTQNAFAVNINELLNTSTDRRARLQSHLLLLKKLDTEGIEHVKKMQAEMAVLKAQYDLQVKAQDVAEANFFAQVSAFNAPTAEDLLSDFIAASREVVSLRARYRVLEKLVSYYVIGLPRLEDRIKDVELNAEPLIEGLKVYDVTGSDLELIVPVKGVSDATTQAFGSTPVKSQSGVAPFIYSGAQGGVDHITQPGGGF